MSDAHANQVGMISGGVMALFLLCFPFEQQLYAPRSASPASSLS
jgi:hypothetical protein